ncbi:hypothetical protein [Cryobacterium aureum]|uniref:hypothetical protein n=1 Tax=Cryobacterium aureum TaxID=995037 RepID=UPI000CF3DB26|nr:hypothetical protein [Cryobacterium aureum]
MANFRERDRKSIPQWPAKPVKRAAFTRHGGRDDEGMIGTYTCLGPVAYVTNEGEKPIVITWNLQGEMPADVYLSASAVPR